MNAALLVDAGADRSQAVLRAVARAARAESVEAVAEDSGRPMSEKGVLSSPAFPVTGVERVDVDVTAVVVERRADARRGEAIHGLSVVGKSPEQMVVAAAVDPVRPCFQHRNRSRPVREVKFPRAEPTAPRAVEVRKRPAPRLKRPVRAVGRSTGGDLERQLRPVVRTALVPERGPIPA